MTRREFEPANVGDKALVKRIGELLQAQQATEAALAAAVNEYSRRRINLVRAGKPIEGALREPIAPSPNFQADQFRREQIAQQGYEHEQDLRRDPHTRTLLAPEG
jgi:hypothetical protein